MVEFAERRGGKVEGKNQKVKSCAVEKKASQKQRKRWGKEESDDIGWGSQRRNKKADKGKRDFRKYGIRERIENKERK